MKNKLYYLLLVLIGVTLLGTYSYTLDEKLDLNGDNATYIILARNMAQGLGYSSVTVDGIKPASHFPPGYSFILSIFMRMGIDNLLFFKILNALFLFASLCLLFFVFKRCTKQVWLIACILVLSCFSTQLLHFAGMVMSEMSYMFFTVLGVFALWQYAESDKKEWYSSPWFWIAIVASMSAYHIRTVGMALMLSIVIFFLFRKQWIAAGASLVSQILLMVPWILRNKQYGIESRYFGTIMTVNPWRPEEGTISSVGEFIEKMWTNLDQTVIAGFPQVLFPFAFTETNEPSGAGMIIVGLIVLAMVIWGAWNTDKMRWLMLALLAGNIGLFALWHGGNGTRYVTPIIPLVYLFFYNGVFACIKLLFKDKVEDDTKWALILLFMIFPMIKPLQVMHKQSAMPYNPAYRNYFHMAKEMNKKLPKGTVVSCRKPELFLYYAPNLYTTGYRFDTNPDSVIIQMVRQKVDYVIFEQLGYSSTPRYLLPAIQHRPQLYPVVWNLERPDTYLLKFDRTKAEQLLINE